MNEKGKVILVEPIVQAYTVQNTTIPVISAEDVIVVDDAIQASSTPRNNTEASNLLGSDFVDYSAGLPPPDNFSKCEACCCAYRCCTSSACFGCRGNCLAWCFEEDSAICQTISENPRTCCIVYSRNFEIVKPVNSCKCYRQCFCCEWVCGYPFNSVYVQQSNFFKQLALPPREESKLKTNSILCSAFFCTLSNLYGKVPECLSGYQQSICCCVELEDVCFKMLCFDDNRPKKSTLCILDKGHCYLVCPKAGCKSVSQVCCLDNRCALPCDNDVPCALTCLPFCTLGYKWGLNVHCCASIDLLNKGSP